MSGETLSTQIPLSVAISIPGSGTAIASCKLIDLIKGVNLGKPGPNIQITIGQFQPASATERLAFFWGSARQGATVSETDITTHGSYVDEGEVMNVPSERVGDLYVRSATASAVSALAILL